MADYQVLQRLYTENGVAVSKEYLSIEEIGEGYYKVSKLENGNVIFNIINRKGIEISNEWFSAIGEYHNGKAIVVMTDGKYNLITKHAKKLFAHSRDYESLEYVVGDLYIAKNKNGKYGIIGKQNKLLHEAWFYKITDITSQGALVSQTETRGKRSECPVIKYNYNYLTADGKFLLIRACPKVQSYDGYVRAYFNESTDRYNKGKVLWQRIVRIRDGRVTAEGRFVNISDIGNGYKLIQREGNRNQYNLLDPGYDLVFDEWFDDISVFFYGYNNSNVFFAAGNKIGKEIKFRIYDEEKKDIFEKHFDTLYPLNTKKGEYVFIKGEEQYKAYMMEKILSKI